MVRVKIICEGKTELRFIQEVLAPYLSQRTVFVVPMLLGVSGHQGGRVNYARLRKDILNNLKQDATAFCSTLLDLYGLQSDFPGMMNTDTHVGSAKASLIEDAILRDITSIIKNVRAETRLIPYLQVHEYEGLLFSDTAAFSHALGKDNLASKLAGIRNQFLTPEDINEGPTSAPSKRVIALYPQYKKVIEGTIAAQRIGIDRMLAECPHFCHWIERLVALPAEGDSERRAATVQSPPQPSGRA